MEWLKKIGDFFDKLVNPHLMIIDQMMQILTLYRGFLEKILDSQQFNSTLGGIIVLSVALMTLVNVIVFLIMISTFWKGHGHRISMLFSTVWAQVLFYVGFYPLASLGLVLITALQWLVAAIVGIEPAKLVDEVNKSLLLPTLDPLWSSIIIVLIIILGLVLMIEMAAIMVFTVLFLLLYPIIIALRPLGRAFDSMFHAFTAGIIVMIVSPPLTFACLAIPIIVRQHVPFGGAGVLQAVLIVISYGTAIAVPVLLWKSLRNRSIRAYGKLEASVSGIVDVNSLPPQSYEGGMRTENEAVSSPLRSMTEVALLGGVAALLGDRTEAMETIKNVGADVAAAGLAATGHPLAAAGVQAYNSATRGKAEKNRAEQEELAKFPPPEMPLSAYPPPPPSDQPTLPTEP